jgi:hypothetical protein
MQELAQSLFDIYALSLPRGHGFGDRPPVAAWQSADGVACGVVTSDSDRGFGFFVMRRQTDDVWTTTAQGHGFESMSEARARMEPPMREGGSKEPLPRNTAPRPALHDLQGRTASDTFKVLWIASHHRAAWILNQLYLALPRPDKNWASDCQTGNFHTRLWEAQLLASFREQGLPVTQPYESPDFRIENRFGGEAWVEAVTANPAVPYNHVNAPRSPRQWHARSCSLARRRYALRRR